VTREVRKPTVARYDDKRERESMVGLLYNRVSCRTSLLQGKRDLVTVFTKVVRYPGTPAEIFDWFARPGAFTRLLAPWERTKLIERIGNLEPGSRTVFDVGTLWPLRHRWIAEHVQLEPPHLFVDVQRHGPFTSWVHTHRITADGPDSTRLEDQIEYVLPFGALGHLLGNRLVSSRLQQVFNFRHRLVARDLKAHRAHADRGGRRLRVAITGSTGVLGTALSAFLDTGGHQVLRLVRDRSQARQGQSIFWDPAAKLDSEALAGCDAVVHLAGAPIADRRWTPSFKEMILSSRLESTRGLAEAISRMRNPPRTLLCASAIGYYGNQEDRLLEDGADSGVGFLAHLCREWEAAARPAEENGCRVVNLRIGVVLSTAGGALSWMLPFFSAGLGGAVGSGRQWMSWVDRDDVVRAILHLLSVESVSGPVNMVAPNPVTQLELARTLARVLFRPAIVPVPAAFLRFVLGEMAGELLLSSQRVRPTKLLESGFQFDTPGLEDCLREQLGRVDLSRDAIPGAGS
jgi:uncharacterized protein (TIGR01777 family)